MNPPTLDDLLELATGAAVDAGTRAAAGRGTSPGASGLEVDSKSTITDLVTEHDRAAENVLVDRIISARPDDAIVGEEGTDRPGRSGISWYLDPIDGTTNFVYGLPGWATSVAAGDGGGMLVGVVFIPALDELFCAARGRGATLNGRPIRASAASDLAVSLVATGFGYAPEQRRRQGRLVADLLGAVRDIRRLGAAAVDLCHAACGRVDAYFEAGLNVWDIAAGELIAREAGCVTSDFGGATPTPRQVVAAAPGIHTELLAHLDARGDTPASPVSRA
ncbi:MAG: inositol monophosphatase family protein [Desertimonas sp.]